MLPHTLVTPTTPAHDRHVPRRQPQEHGHERVRRRSASRHLRGIRHRMCIACTVEHGIARGSPISTGPEKLPPADARSCVGATGLRTGAATGGDGRADRTFRPDVWSRWGRPTSRRSSATSYRSAPRASGQPANPRPQVHRWVRVTDGEDPAVGAQAGSLDSPTTHGEYVRRACRSLLLLRVTASPTPFRYMGERARPSRPRRSLSPTNGEPCSSEVCPSTSTRPSRSPRSNCAGSGRPCRTARSLRPSCSSARWTCGRLRVTTTSDPGRTCVAPLRGPRSSGAVPIVSASSRRCARVRARGRRRPVRARDRLLAGRR